MNQEFCNIISELIVIVKSLQDDVDLIIHNEKERVVLIKTLDYIRFLLNYNSFNYTINTITTYDYFERLLRYISDKTSYKEITQKIHNILTDKNNQEIIIKYEPDNFLALKKSIFIHPEILEKYNYLEDGINLNLL